MKSLVYFITGLLVFTISQVNAQERYITDEGHVTFFSDAPLEDITASSNKLRAILDIESGKAIAKISIRSFDFRIRLMEEHFNENFMESEEYPEATFNGKLRNLKSLKTKNSNTSKLPFEGTITIHGVTRPIKDTVNLTYSNSFIKGELMFFLKPEDFDIEIPKILTKKIAEEVKVTVNFNMKPHKE
mgnify:CR=1 FL=1